jgi:PAS domain S-box-containing protein
MIMLLVISTIVDLAVTVYYLSQGTTVVFQNIYYFTIVLASYWYKWRGALLSSALSATYLCLCFYFDPQVDPALQAIVRSVIFILIAMVVAYLSTRLENERKRYHAIFSKANSGMATVLMDDHRILEANRRFHEITGEETVEGKSLELFFKEKDIAKLSESNSSAEGFSDVEMKICSRLGGERTCLVSGSSLGSHEFLLSLSDVSNRKKMEESLQESEEKFREIFNLANDAIYLNELGLNFELGTFKDVNQAACRMLGYSHEEMLRMTFNDFVTHSQQPISEERWRHLIKEGTVRFEDLYRRADGNVIPVEVNALLVKIAGHPMALTLVRDIAERKHIEEEQRLREETMRLVLTSAPFPLMITNWDGTYILDANSQAMMAFGLDIGQGEQVADLFVEKIELATVMDILTKQGSLDGMEVSLYGKDGDRQWHVLSARTISYPGEERLLLATYDITKRRVMEEALHEVNLKLGILNSITRHDITNQMTVLNGFIELGKQREKDPTLVSYFEKMSRAAINVQGQIAFTKDYQDMGVKAPLWVPIGQQTTVAFAILHPPGVMIEDATEGVEILADQLVEKVPYNLIDNSIRHGEHVTNIKMSAEPVGDAMLIVYQDDGMGITEKDREHLFEKGFGKNTGLGLFLVREILTITGIAINENGRAGQGVRFEMLVPAGAWRHSST